MLPGKSVISGGQTGFLVLPLPGCFLSVNFFFPRVIVIFDLCQFLFGAGLHAVYLCLPVLCLQGGKFLRQPALGGKPLFGFRFRILTGLFGVGMSAYSCLFIKFNTFFGKIFSSTNITVVFFLQPFQFLLFFPATIIILFVGLVGRKETVNLSAIPPPCIKFAFILRLCLCNLIIDF